MISGKEMESKNFSDSEKRLGGGGYFIKQKGRYTWRRCQVYCQMTFKIFMKKKPLFQNKLFEPGQAI